MKAENTPEVTIPENFQKALQRLQSRFPELDFFVRITDTTDPAQPVRHINSVSVGYRDREGQSMNVTNEDPSANEDRYGAFWTFNYDTNEDQIFRDFEQKVISDFSNDSLPEEKKIESEEQKRKRLNTKQRQRDNDLRYDRAKL